MNKSKSPYRRNASNRKEHNTLRSRPVFGRKKFRSPKRIKCLDAYSGMYAPENGESPQCQMAFYSYENKNGPRHYPYHCTENIKPSLIDFINQHGKAKIGYY